MLDAAVQYALEGWAVFPLVPKGKIPANKDGFKSATTDTGIVKNYWLAHSTANVGIATGETSGIVVIDVDDEAGLGELGELPPTMTARTGSGGRHLIFEHPGRPVANRAGVVPGIDVRGDGGYIVAPPSVHPNGTLYEWLDNRNPAPLPSHLLELIVKKPPVLSAPPADFLGQGLGTKWGEKILDEELPRLMASVPGERNHTLNDVAFRLFSIVKGGQLAEGSTRDAIQNAALAVGLEPNEVAKTMDSAWTASTPRAPRERLPEPKRPEKQEPEHDEKIRVLTRSDLDTVQPPEWLVDGICTTGFTVLYGPSGAGKSFVALDWACHVATGTKWFNRFCSRRRTLYVAAEGVSGIPRRVKAWESDRDARAEDFLLVPQVVNLLKSEADDLERVVERRKVGLLIVDTLARSMPGGDENGAQDMGRLIDTLTRIQTRQNCSVLLIHHSGIEGRRPRGSTALFGAADTVARVDRVEETVTLSCDKQKDDDAFGSWHLRMKPVGESIVLTLGGQKHIDDTRAFVLASLDQGPPQTWMELVRLAGGDSKVIAILLDKNEITEAASRGGATTYKRSHGEPLEGWSAS